MGDSATSDFIKSADPIGSSAGKYNEEGGKFGGSHPVAQSILSSQQESLLGPLGAFFGNEIGKVPGEVGQINRALSGDSPFVSGVVSRVLKDALLAPALKSFEEVAKPAIEGGFAQLGGSLSSRRTQAVAKGYSDVISGATAQAAGLVPDLLRTEIAGRQAQATLRYLPTQQAFGFATQPTRSLGQVTTPDTSGYYQSLAGSAAGLGYLAFSDERVKKDVKPIRGAAAKVKKLKGVEFNYKDPNTHGQGRRVGVLAQNVQEVFPELVVDGPGGVKMVRTHGFEGVLIEAFKELSSEIDKLKRRKKK